MRRSARLGKWTYDEIKSQVATHASDDCDACWSEADLLNANSMHSQVVPGMLFPIAMKDVNSLTGSGCACKSFEQTKSSPEVQLRSTVFGGVELR